MIWVNFNIYCNGKRWFDRGKRLFYSYFIFIFLVKILAWFANTTFSLVGLGGSLLCIDSCTKIKWMEYLVLKKWAFCNLHHGSLELGFCSVLNLLIFYYNFCQCFLLLTKTIISQYISYISFLAAHLSIAIWRYFYSIMTNFSFVF